MYHNEIKIYIICYYFSVNSFDILILYIILSISLYLTIFSHFYFYLITSSLLLFCVLSLVFILSSLMYMYYFCFYPLSYDPPSTSSYLTIHYFIFYGLNIMLCLNVLFRIVSFLVLPLFFSGMSLMAFSLVLCFIVSVHV